MPEEFRKMFIEWNIPWCWSGSKSRHKNNVPYNPNKNPIFKIYANDYDTTSLLSVNDLKRLIPFILLL